MRRALTWCAGIAVAFGGVRWPPARWLMDLRWHACGRLTLADDCELISRPGRVRMALERWTLSRAAWLTERGQPDLAGQWLRAALFVGDRRPGRRSPGPAERWLDRMIAAGRVNWTNAPGGRL